VRRLRPVFYARRRRDSHASLRQGSEGELGQRDRWESIWSEIRNPEAAIRTLDVTRIPADAVAFYRPFHFEPFDQWGTSSAGTKPTAERPSGWLTRSLPAVMLRLTAPTLFFGRLHPRPWTCRRCRSTHERLAFLSCADRLTSTRAPLPEKSPASSCVGGSSPGAGSIARCECLNE
jgi:hypothetical protein